MLGRLRRYLQRRFRPIREFDAAPGYDLLASSYDDDLRNNGLLAMDEQVFCALLERASPEGKIVVDVGCGTGRHWKTLRAHRPAQLVGYDVSPAMLSRLREKYPDATVRIATDHRLPELPDESCDLLVSTLAFGYLPDQDAVLTEWSRALKPTGEIVLTDVHPVVAARGYSVFPHRGSLISVRDYPHPLGALTASAAHQGFDLLHLEERNIEDWLRPLYEAENALELFLRYRGSPLLYGMHLRKGPRTSAHHASR